MSYNKMNVFHWHLTDTQSFPFVSKRVPEMADYGAYSSRYFCLIFVTETYLLPFFFYYRIIEATILIFPILVKYITQMRFKTLSFMQEFGAFSFFQSLMHLLMQDTVGIGVLQKD